MMIDRLIGRSLAELKNDENLFRGILTDAGTVFKGKSCCCVFCSDVHPSAGLYSPNGDGWRYKCHSCQFQGDVIDVMAKLDGLDVAEVLRRLKGDNRSNSRPTPQKPKLYPSIEALSQAMPYPVEQIYKYHDIAGKLDMLTFRLKLPDGDKTFRQARPVSGGFFMQAPPKPWKLYNRLRVSKADMVVVVEGESKTHSLNAYGFVGTTSPGGAGKAKHSDWTPLLGKTIILWPDNDTVGISHMKDVEKILQELSPTASISTLDPTALDLTDKQDVVDYIKRLESTGLDKGKIRQEIQQALQTGRSGSPAAGLCQLLDDTISGKRQAIRWPWSKVSELTHALLPESVCILCGGVGASKSFALLQAGLYWHVNGVKVAIFMLEESREFHLSRCLAQLAGCGNMTDPVWVKDNPEKARSYFTEYEDAIDSFGAFIYATPQTQPTLPELAKWVRARAKDGCRVVCIDPITAAAHGAGSVWDEDRAFLSDIKKTATDYQCSILLISHPIKSVSFADTGQLAGGAAYARFSQTILWLESHDFKTHNTQTPCGSTEINHNRTLHLLKVRNGRGQGVRLAFTFKGDSLTLQENGVIVRDKNK